MSQSLEGASLVVPLHALETIQNATTEVRTQLLSQSGIDRIRILSESRFLELVGGVIGSALKARVVGRETPGAAPSAARDVELRASLDRTYEKKWTELRSKHEESLERIEGRMAKLSQVFQGLEAALARADVRGGSGLELQARDAARQKELLRGMLMSGEGEAPAASRATNS